MTMCHLETELRASGDPRDAKWAARIFRIRKKRGSDIPLPEQSAYLEQNVNSGLDLPLDHIFDLLKPKETPKHVLTPEFAIKVSRVVGNYPDSINAYWLFDNVPNSQQEISVEEKACMESWNLFRKILSPLEKGQLSIAFGAVIRGIRDQEELQRTGRPSLEPGIGREIFVKDLRVLYDKVIPDNQYLDNSRVAFIALAFKPELPQTQESGS